MNSDNFAAKTIRDLSPEERPYERCAVTGPGALTDTELVAVLLRTGTRGRDVLEVARNLVYGTPYGGLAALVHMTREEFLSIDGIGEVKAMQLACIGELVRRLWRYELSGRDVQMTAPSVCADYYMQELKFLEHEEMHAAFLDIKGRLICDIIVSVGTISSSLVSVRELLIEALRRRAVGMIVVHNHPSGSCDPSEDDITTTWSIREGCQAVGITLLDHIIIADNSFYSFREHQMME
jgi:DNA repair protein RadC